MSTETATAPPAASFLRIAFGLGGLIAVVVGVLILVWPAKTAMVVAAMIAIYAITAGLVYAALGIFSLTKGGWARTGHIVLGGVFVAAGLFALFNLGATTAWLAAVIGVLVGIMWIVEGVVSLTMIGKAPAKIWTMFFAGLSILAGVVLLFSPLYISVLWWLLGISMVVLGVVQIVRALSIGKGEVTLAPGYKV